MTFHIIRVAAHVSFNIGIRWSNRLYAIIHMPTLSVGLPGTYFMHFITFSGIINVQVGTATQQSVKSSERRTRSSAIAEGPRDALCHHVSWNLVDCCMQLYEKSRLKKPAAGEWPWRLEGHRGHRNCRYSVASQVTTHFPTWCESTCTSGYRRLDTSLWYTIIGISKTWRNMQPCFKIVLCTCYY